MYAKNLVVHKGTDNTVFIEFKNPDQKKEMITGKTITLVVFRDDDGTTYLDLPVSVHDGANGIGKLIIPEAAMFNMESAVYKYAIKVLDSEGNAQASYVDDNYGVRGNFELRDGPKPTFIPSTELTFQPSSATSYRSGAAQGNAKHQANQALHTAQYFFDDFTGDVRVYATMDPVALGLDVANYFLVDTIAYVDQTDPALYSFNGVFSGVRFEYEAVSGSVTSVSYRP